ncbi:MAG: hypothetical protein R2861_15745 [Desulfobacterales bacterium]
MQPLPDAYKEAMVLKPGIQGNSPIVGESLNNTHVFEYMRGQLIYSLGPMPPTWPMIKSATRPMN